MWALKIKRKFNSLHLVPQKNLTLSARTSCAGREAFEKREMAPKCVCLVVCLSVCLSVCIFWFPPTPPPTVAFLCLPPGKNLELTLCVRASCAGREGFEKKLKTGAQICLPVSMYVHVCLCLYIFLLLPFQNVDTEKHAFKLPWSRSGPHLSSLLSPHSWSPRSSGLQSPCCSRGQVSQMQNLDRYSLASTCLTTRLRSISVFAYYSWYLCGSIGGTRACTYYNMSLPI